MVTIYDGMPMRSYRTMTPSGCYGTDYQAPNAERAAELAEADGYSVLDITDNGHELVLVVSET